MIMKNSFSGGTLPELSLEERAELAAEQQRIQSELELTQPEVEQPEVSQAAATAAPVEAPPQQTEEPLINGRPLSYYADPTGAEAMVAGVEDFVLDALNLIPNVDIPKAPKFENDINQSVRRSLLLLSLP